MKRINSPGSYLFLVGYKAPSNDSINRSPFEGLGKEERSSKFKEIINMQRKKTGKLFSFCCFATGQIAGKGYKENIDLIKLGEDIGLLFQLADDFLDVKGKSKYTGKTVNKDKKKGKSTIINLVGYNNAYDYAINLKKKILRKLEKHGNKANDLKNIVNFILERKY